MNPLKEASTEKLKNKLSEIHCYRQGPFIFIEDWGYSPEVLNLSESAILEELIKRETV